MSLLGKERALWPPPALQGGVSGRARGAGEDVGEDGLMDAFLVAFIGEVELRRNQTETDSQNKTLSEVLETTSALLRAPKIDGMETKEAKDWSSGITSSRWRDHLHALRV